MILSIIIPVYNAELYLQECVESIVRGIASNNVELILINDGSTDSSLKICESLASVYPMIRILSGPNCGVSYARNIGIEKAQGKYVTFADSDDWYSDGVIGRLLYDAKKEVDCVIYGVEKVFFDGKEIAKKVIKCGNGELCDRSAFAHDYVYLNQNYNLSSPCAKLYRRQILIENKITFDEKMKQYEDVKFNLQYYSCCKKVYFSDQTVYHWRRVANEKQAKRIYLTMYDDVCRVARQMLEFKNKMELPNDGKQEVDSDLINRYSDCFKNYKVLRKKFSCGDIQKTILVICKDEILLNYISKMKNYPRKMKALVWMAKKQMKGLMFWYLVKFYG